MDSWGNRDGYPFFSTSCPLLTSLPFLLTVWRGGSWKSARLASPPLLLNQPASYQLKVIKASHRLPGKTSCEAPSTGWKSHSRRTDHKPSSPCQKEKQEKQNPRKISQNLLKLHKDALQAISFGQEKMTIHPSQDHPKNLECNNDIFITNQHKPSP